MSRTVPLRLAAGLTLWLGVVSSALAHGSRPHDSELSTGGPRGWQELWRAWEWEPGVVIPLVVSAVWYGRGLRRMWRDGGVGHGVRRWEAACFAGGWLALVVALVSPLHSWGSVLFSAHMTQHEVLMLVAAPLLVLGRPLVGFLKALPTGWARYAVAATGARCWLAVWRTICHPFVAWLIHAAVLWVWHIPVLFEGTLHDELAHALQHASFLAAALLFWWSIMQGPQRAIGYGAAVLYMFTTAIHSGLLGALITVAATVWYPTYLETTRAWGLTPLEDQQLGGLIMWIPACLVYVVAGLALFAGWLRASEERVRRWEGGGAKPPASVPHAEIGPLEMPAP